jgi:hypothetical protein
VNHQPLGRQAGEVLAHTHGRDAQDLGKCRRRCRPARLQEEKDVVGVML